MSTLLSPVQLDGIDGIEPISTNPDVSGNLILNSPRGRVFARISNTNASYDCAVAMVTTKVVAEGSSGNLTVQDPSVSIPSQESRVIGPWTDNFENGSNQIELAWSNVGAGGTEVPVADVDIEVFKIV